MTGNRRFSDSVLHAFVDGQLETADRKRLLATMEVDVELRDRVCELRRSKEWVRLAFEGIRAPVLHPNGTAVIRRRSVRPAHAVAASLLLGIGGFLLGWFVQDAQRPSQPSVGNIQIAQEQAGGVRALLHIDRSDAAAFMSILDDAERLLGSDRGGRIAVDVVANAGGLDLFRADVSPYAERIARMSREYDNLRFIVCGNSLERLREQGFEPMLVKEVDSSTTAVEHIVDRLQRGWSYIRA